MTHTELIAKVGGAIKAKFEPDPRALEALEEALLSSADVGPATAAELVAAVREEAGRRDAGEADVVRRVLKAEIARRLTVAGPPVAAGAPHVVFMVGVNGTGKTTTTAKLAARAVQARRVRRPRRRGHVPRRRGRTAADLGRPARHPAREAQVRRRPGRGRPRRLRRCGVEEGGRPLRRHRGPPAHEAQPHGRALEDAACRRAPRPRRAPRGPPRPRRRDGHERHLARRASSRSPRA